MRRVAFWLSLVLLMSQAVTAQPAPVSRVVAYVRMRQADQAMQRGEVEEAVRLYREAADMGAPGPVYRALALALEHRSRWRQAAEAWTRYATVAEREADRADAVTHREALRTMLTTIRVRVIPAAGGRVARVWFDREPPRWYQAGGVEAVMDGGEHRIRVEATGYIPWEQRVTTGYGEPAEITVTLHQTERADGG